MQTISNSTIRKMDSLHSNHVIFACMEFQSIKSFISVVECGAVTEAARRLSVTQPALSRRIQQFESQMGAILLVRGRQGVDLTEIGRVVYDECKILLSRFEQLQAEVASLKNLSGGTIRLGGGATAVSYMLPGAIADFQRRYPDIHFQLKEAGSAEIAANVVDGSLEIGIVTLPVKTGDLNITPLGEDRIVLVGRHDHPLAQLQKISLQQLSGYSFVGFEAGSAIRQIIDNTLRASGVEMNVVMELRSIPAILSMVITTGNLAFVSRQGLSGQAGISEIKVAGLRMTRELAVVSHPSGRLSPGADAFLDALKKVPGI
ncbi:MAG: DNA-binding transcriptional LysR family regulator [Parasphingorhabdus sp.]|jgi:DNA-binding transcriptional LysR family regulator